MLSAALQSKLIAIVPNTFMLMGDEDVATPYCVHEERQRPVWLKKGVAGYEYDCEIALVADLPDVVETYKGQIRTALEAMEGTTVEGTAVELVEYLGDDPGFDVESKEYINISRYLIQTSNI